MSRVLTLGPLQLMLAANALLLLPYCALLVSLWLKSSKDAAASGLAFAGAVVFAWSARESLKARSPAHPMLGFAIFLVAVLLYVSAVAVDFRIVMGASAAAMITSQVYLSFGGAGVRTLSAPLFLFLLATPVPGFVLSEISRLLLDFSTEIMPPLLEPFVGSIQVEGYKLLFGEGFGRGIEIVEDCSGLGGILLFVPLAVILLQAHGRVSLVAGSIIVLLSPVFGYVGSLFRIFVTGLFTNTDSSILRSAVMHDILGIASLLLTGIFMLLACKVVGRKQ